MKLIIIAAAALAAVAIAAATDEADAQTVSPAGAALMQAVRHTPTQTPAFAPRYTGDRPVRIAGVAQTSVDTRLSEGEGVVGSLGFMCGLKPGAEKYGAAAAHGYDDTGRFVGAKLRVAFK